MPLATLWTEAEIARDRINGRIATEAILIRAAIVDSIAGGNHLGDSIDRLLDE